MPPTRSAAVVAGVIAWSLAPAGATPQYPYQNPALPVDQRVDDLIGRMTLSEKAYQMVNHATAIPRLGVSEYDWWSEGLHGIVATHASATVFPEPIGLASSYDLPLINAMGHAIAVEARLAHAISIKAGRHNPFEGLTLYTPNINIFRDPRWGRGQETYGEDPVLTGRMAVALITGLQGDEPSHLLVGATAKHFAAYSGPEAGRHGFNAVVSAHDAADTYLPAFRSAVIDGHVASVMCSYNEVNGVPACANITLLQTHLRNAWQFKGFVASDCDAVNDFVGGHHYVATDAQAAARAVLAGLDNECQNSSMFDHGAGSRRYVQAVEQGLLPLAALDQALRRSLRIRFMTGAFDTPDPVPDLHTPAGQTPSVSTPAHAALALQAARESMVLLKNDGVLPLAQGALHTIAVVGPMADQTAVMEGNYHGRADHTTSFLEGLREQFPGAHILYEDGAPFPMHPSLIPAARLTTPDGHPGLLAEHFVGDKPEGKPFQTEIVEQLDAARIEVTPPAGTTSYSTQWTGFLTPDLSGRYLLGVKGMSDRMFLDGKLLADDPTPHEPRARMSMVNLVARRRYALKVEAAQGIVPMQQLVWQRNDADALEKAVAIARQADVIIASVGIDSSLEGEESADVEAGFFHGDRTTIALPREEERLLAAIGGAGHKIVVVLNNGSALSVGWAKEHANAILEAWYPGQAGGAAIAETLAGRNNPAGRLPITFYASDDQLPPFTSYSMKERTYRYFHGQPLYPFGQGLSYTTFSADDLKLSANSVQAGDGLQVTLRLHNTGSTAGTDVVQIYITPPALPGTPITALRQFVRVTLSPGESTTVPINLLGTDLSHVDLAGRRLVSPGMYDVAVVTGASMQAPGTLHATVRVNGVATLPD